MPTCTVLLIVPFRELPLLCPADHELSGDYAGGWDRKSVMVSVPAAACLACGATDTARA
jgi:hypothetical protein